MAAERRPLAEPGDRGDVMEAIGATTGAGVEGSLRAQERLLTFCILCAGHTHRPVTPCLADRGPCPTLAATRPGAGGHEHPEPAACDTGCLAAIPGVPATGRKCWRGPPAPVALFHRSPPAR